MINELKKEFDITITRQGKVYKSGLTQEEYLEDCSSMYEV